MVIVTGIWDLSVTVVDLFTWIYLLERQEAKKKC